MDHFSTRSLFEVFNETPAEELTEANRHTRLSWPKQSLNGVVFISFSDKKLLSYTTYTISIAMTSGKSLSTFRQRLKTRLEHFI